MKHIRVYVYNGCNFIYVLHTCNVQSFVCKNLKNKHSAACIYLPLYKLDVLKIVEYKFSCEMEAHVEVTSLMFDCNTFKDKRHLLILVAITLPSKELQFCHFIMQINSK